MEMGFTDIFNNLLLKLAEKGILTEEEICRLHEEDKIKEV